MSPGSDDVMGGGEERALLASTPQKEESVAQSKKAPKIEESGDKLHVLVEHPDAATRKHVTGLSVGTTQYQKRSDGRFLVRAEHMKDVALQGYRKVD